MPDPYTLQNMPPRAAHFCLGIERFCREDLGVHLGGSSILIAYSGGADSKALLFVLHALSFRLGFTVLAATLDHGLRAASAGEVTDAAAMCASLGIPFISERADIKKLARERKIGFEEAGREARLAFFSALREETRCDWIAFGHQLNDLAEDSVMRLVRGSGWPGLGGMAGAVPERAILRPLLLTPRKDIEIFLTDLELDWVRDPMNADPAYFRNRVRENIIPLLEMENPAFLETVAMRWRMARDDGDFLADMMRAIPDIEQDGGVFLGKSALEKTPAPVRLRKYRAVLASFGPGQATATLLYALDRAWLRGEGGKTVQFPGGKEAVVRHGGILFSRPSDRGR